MLQWVVLTPQQSLVESNLHQAPKYQRCRLMIVHQGSHLDQQLRRLEGFPNSGQCL
jgi:hypothetical protein